MLSLLFCHCCVVIVVVLLLRGGHGARATDVRALVERRPMEDPPSALVEKTVSLPPYFFHLGQKRKLVIKPSKIHRISILDPDSGRIFHVKFEYDVIFNDNHNLSLYN